MKFDFIIWDNAFNEYKTITGYEAKNKKSIKQMFENNFIKFIDNDTEYDYVKKTGKLLPENKEILGDRFK